MKVEFLQDFKFQNKEYKVGDTEDLQPDVAKELIKAKVIKKATKVKQGGKDASNNNSVLE